MQLMKYPAAQFNKKQNISSRITILDICLSTRIYLA